MVHLWLLLCRGVYKSPHRTTHDPESENLGVVVVVGVVSSKLRQKNEKNDFFLDKRVSMVNLEPVNNNLILGMQFMTT